MGKAKNLKNRVSSYFTKIANIEPKTAQLISRIDRIKIINTQSELESLLLEAYYIKKFLPEYNIKLTDKKAFPLIRITIKERIPVVLTSRNESDKNSIYFGPFPNPGAMRLVLRILRRIFPYQSVVNHPKKICFYNHLNLCPCPERTGEIKSYRKNIKYMIQFLNGKIDKVVKNLEKERNTLSNLEKYEEAEIIQRKIDSIKLVTSPIHKPFEYEINPNLSSDIRTKELSELKTILKKNGYSFSSFLRIECYDISNISGKFSVGSMTVFINGEKNTSLYRRFRIKTDGRANDFAMLREVLLRRLRHTDWGSPDLIVVDGGKGQVSSAVSAVFESGKITPVIGLTKKQEIIITENLSEINLSKRSDALKLLMRIRDESHRFAISYHKKLRSKFILQGNSL